nr:reverse transcriptase domain-containing protein [Tanacetum cinerariifolium]
MSSASSAVTYTFVYTDSERGSPRVIMYGYDGLPMQPPHDPDYVPEPMYPKYIPLVDEHVFPANEHPLPPVDSPTVELPGYVADSYPKEDQEEYRVDESEDGLVDYPIDGGDDGDDDDGDSSGDDVDDEDEDEEVEEEHLALADFVVVIPTVELVTPPEGIELVIPPPSADIATTRARITVRLQAFISLPPETEVEKILAMPTPPPSPLASLSPAFVRERLARCTAQYVHSSPPHVPSPLLPSSGYPTQIQTLRMASTQAFIDAVTAALPSPPLSPPLYIPPPVDHRDDVLETQMPPRKRLCLSTLSSRYEIGESSTARPIEGREIDCGFVSTLDVEARRRWIGEVGYELAEPYEHDTQDLYALLKDAQDNWTHISQRVTMDSQRVDLLMEDRIDHQETILIVEEEAYTDHRRQAQMVVTLRVMGDMRREMGDMQVELLALREQPRRARQQGSDARVPDHQDAPMDQSKNTASVIQIMAPVTRHGLNIPPNNTNLNNMTPESVQATIDQALLRNSTNGDGSHSSHKDNRRNVQTACPCFYADFMKCQPLNFKGTKGVVSLTQWIEKMESVFQISGCAIKNQVKYATCTLLNAALTWWNSQIRSLGPDEYSMTWEVLKKKMTDKYYPQREIKKLEIELWNLKVKGNDVPTYTARFQELTLICTKFVANETEKIDKYISRLHDNMYGSVKSSKPKTLDETIELANDFRDQKLRNYAERQTNNKRKADDLSRFNHGHQQQLAKRQNVAKVYNIGSGEK